MAAASRVDPKTYFAPDQWARLAAHSNWRGLALLAHAWIVILAAGAMVVVWPLTLPLAVMIIGGRQLGLAILMHEAAHGALTRNLRLNDVLGHWLCAVPIGASLPAYRPYHLGHHRHAQQSDDPDLILSAPFPVTPASLRRKIIRDLTGQTFFKQRVLLPLAAQRGRTATGETDTHDYEAVVTGRSVAPFLLVNAAMLLALTLADLWWAYFVLWLLPMATWFPLVTRLRNIAEHACVEGSATDPMRAARTTRASWWERAFIAPYWVNFHAEHHLFMWVNCDKLPAVHDALRKKGLLARMEVAPGYVSVLRTACGRAS